MAPWIKLCVGIAGTSLLATAAYKLNRAPLLSTLGARTADVMVAHGITDGRANWVTPGGWTFRVARLSGTADAATRARTRAAVADLTGISDALWEDQDHGTPPRVAIAVGIPADVCGARIDGIVAATPLEFGTADATIAAASLRAVDAVAQALQACPAASVTVIGHVALPGARAINLALSQARAEAVRTALRQRGIAVTRMQAIGKGNTAPLAPAGSPANQRIQFELHEATR